jgi:hypothetical protein
MPSNNDGGYDVSGNEENVNLGNKCEGATLDENKCGCLQTLDRQEQGKNDNADKCENNLMNRGEGMKGSDKICGGKGKTQLFDMGWMKNG